MIPERDRHFCFIGCDIVANLISGIKITDQINESLTVWTYYESQI